MADGRVLLDVLLTWMGALGCVLYGAFLWRQRGQSGLGALRSLVTVLAVLLTVRGFAWLFDGAALQRLALGVATLLPLSITLFCERLLRRHHPLWLKLLALGVTVLSFVLNASLAWWPQWTTTVLAVLIAGMTAVVAGNGALLWRADRASLSSGEWRLARTLVVVALLSVPLLLSDFRTTVMTVFPLRLGALAALVFITVMLSAAARTLAPAMLLGRLLLVLLWALALALLMAIVASLHAATDIVSGTLDALPVACAWLLLGTIVAGCREVARDDSAAEFMAWLQRAPVGDADAFIAALPDCPPLRGAVLLQADALQGYDLDAMWRIVDDRAPIAVSAMRDRSAGMDRAASVDPGADSIGAAEQWCDLFERYLMTHALPVSRLPPRVVLANLPAATADAAVMRRVAVVQHIARTLAAPAGPTA